VDAAVAYVRSRGDGAPGRLLSAGASRGGILALVHAAERPGLFQGAVSFVGGWLGEACADAVVVNRSLAVSAAAFDGPTLWLYGENDSFYSLAHSRASFDAFVAAGGQGSFKSYTRAPTLNGHFILEDPTLWTADLAAFVSRVGH
jgi:dienelactone hydrolase